jgi:hypothetical protein
MNACIVVRVDAAAIGPFHELAVGNYGSCSNWRA